MVKKVGIIFQMITESVNNYVLKISLERLYMYHLNHMCSTYYMLITNIIQGGIIKKQNLTTRQIKKKTFK